MSTNSKSPVRDVTLKVRELMQCQGAVDILRGMKIKGGKGARRIVKLVSILSIELKDVEAARDALVIAHGEERPDGSHAVDMTNVEAANPYLKALNELMDDEVEIRFRPVCMGDFGTIEVPVGELADIQRFFDFEEDEIPDREGPVQEVPAAEAG